MPTIIRLLVLATCVTITLRSGVTDLCDLTSRDLTTGEHLALSARMGFTAHGMFLLTDKCSKKVPALLVLTPHDEGAPDVGFELDGEALHRLSPFLRLTGGGTIACGTLVGQFASKPHFRTEGSGAELRGNGFGHQGVFQFAFILQSVAEIHACE